MAWCEPSALPDSLMITGAGSMPRSMHTSYVRYEKRSYNEL